MESLDKLREVARQREVPTTTKLVTTYVRPSSELRYWTEHDIADALEAAIGEIEKEIGERYTPLPLDADGVPIHVGDTLTDGEYEFKVHHITFYGNGNLSILDERDYGWAACDVTHVQPDSWEQIIEDVRRRTSDYYCNRIPCDFGKMAEEMVARCKALAGKGE